MLTLAIVSVICSAAYFITTLICKAYTTGRKLKNKEHVSTTNDLARSVERLRGSVDKLRGEKKKTLKME